jgi:hypothetical protein
VSGRHALDYFERISTLYFGNIDKSHAFTANLRRTKPDVGRHCGTTDDHFGSSQDWMIGSKILERPRAVPSLAVLVSSEVIHWQASTVADSTPTPPLR